MGGFLFPACWHLLDLVVCFWFGDLDLALVGFWFLVSFTFLVSQFVVVDLVCTGSGSGAMFLLSGPDHGLGSEFGV